MISTQLLSKVLGFKLYVIDRKYVRYNTCPRENDLVYETPNEVEHCISIFEVMSKCKEWAKNNGYLLISGYDDGSTFYCTCANKSMPDTYGQTEQETVFSACQWILENTHE